MNTRALPRVFQLCGFLLLLLFATSAQAAYPPYVIYNGTLYVSSSSGGMSGEFQAYQASDSALLLWGANGGTVSLGSTNSDLTDYNTVGTWDGAFGISGGGTGTFIPGLVVLGSTEPALFGYDGNSSYPFYSSEGIAAYGPLPDNYVFTFGGSNPIYSLQSSGTTTVINAVNGWPPSNVAGVFPSQIYYQNHLLTFSGQTQYIMGAYCAIGWYSGGDLTAELDFYRTPSSSSGQFWGYVGMQGFSGTWGIQDGLLQVMSGAGFTFAPAVPAHGPASVAAWSSSSYWQLSLPFLYTDSEGADVYGDIWGQNSVIINGANVTASGCGLSDFGAWDSATQRFNMGSLALAAVSADGNSLLGLPEGVTVVTLTQPAQNLAGPYGSPQGPDYVLHGANGAFISKFCTALTEGAFLSIDGSPWYRYHTGGLLLDLTTGAGWPPSDLPGFPVTVYVNDVAWTASDSATGGLGQQFWSTVWYYAPGGGSGEYVHLSYGYEGYDLWTWCDGYVGGNYVNGRIDPVTHQLSGGIGVIVSYAPAGSGSPAFGPAGVFYQSRSYLFQVHDSVQARDVYQSASGSLAIGPTGAVSLAGADGVFTPSALHWSTATHTFDSAGVAVYDLLAMDGNGDPLNPPPGLVVYAGDSQIGASLLLGDGQTLDSSSPAVLHYQRADGLWCTRYFCLSPGNLFLLSDADGFYSSYIYRCLGGSGDQVIDASVTGWPPSNLTPEVLYVNNHLATRDDSSYVRNASRESVTYRVQGTGQAADVATLSWSFGLSGNTSSTAPASFSATVSGRYSTFTTFSGTWDGNAAFTGLPARLLITLNPIPATVRFGPPRIQWNGLTFTLDALATALDPNNRDIYTAGNGSGLSIAIGSSGDVTLYQADGNAVGGTYDPATHQFQFSGQNIGSLVAQNAQGVAYSTSGSTPPAQSSEIAGDLDVHGNNFTLGSWLQGGNSVNAFGLYSFNGVGSQPATLEFSSTHQAINWLWTHSAGSDGDWQQTAAMKLDATHAITLYDPAHPGKAAIILDPGGKSHLEPQGDLPMGSFTSGALPAQP